jgi:xanthine dehydrogenase YagS FAD-binding subunit
MRISRITVERLLSHPFSYHRALSAEDAATRLAAPNAVPMGGGTDLLVCIADGLTQPELLVDLRDLPGGRGIDERDDGSVRAGGATRVADVAFDPVIRDRFPVLAAACASVGTPALRAMGTIGGNLCQRPRCWYLRRNIPCLKSGGSGCPAREGENQYLAIVDGGPCYIVHPSDPAVALTALGALVELEQAHGSRTVPIEQFFVLPRDRVDVENVLEPGEFVRAVVIPGDSRGGVQVYHKLMQRGAWDFALVSIAATKRESGDVRLVLGGVAPRPWRVNSSVEEDVASGGLDADAIATLAERALLDAEPLARNAYKVELAASLLRQAMRELTEG